MIAVEQPDMFEEGLPLLPYDGSSGWGGGATSRDRAEEMDRSGKTKAVQALGLRLLRQNGAVGLTGRELSVAADSGYTTGWSALSTLHKEGVITKVTESRGRSQIYVLSEYVNGREEVPHRPHAQSDPVPTWAVLADAWDEGHAASPEQTNPYRRSSDG